MKAVIRIVGIVSAIGAVLATSVTASASTVDQFSMAGSGADAVFSTCTTLPAPDQVCTDTRISVANQITRANGSTSPGTTLSIDVFKYGMDSSGSFFFVSDTAGFGLASMSIDSRLTKASASAAIPVITCFADGTCTDGTMTVSASWSGQGDLRHDIVNFHFSKGDLSGNSHFNGFVRSATATVTVNGSGAGDFVFADMFNVKSVDVLICHMC